MDLYLRPFLYKRSWLWFTPWKNSQSCFFLCWCRRVLTIRKRWFEVNPSRSHWWLPSIHTIPSSSPPHRPFHQRHHHSFVWVATSPPARCRRLSSYSWHCHLSITSHFCPPLRTCRDASCLHELIFPCHCPPLGVNRLNQTTLVLEPNRHWFMAETKPKLTEKTYADSVR